MLSVLVAVVPAIAPAVGRAPPAGVRPAHLSVEALARLNALRANGADCRSGGRFGRAGPLNWHPALAQSAQVHASDMGGARLLLARQPRRPGHARSRRARPGYRWSLGEDIAAGYLDLRGVTDAWMASDSHCATLMNPRLTDVGLACVAGTPNTTYRTYWVLDMARPRR